MHSVSQLMRSLCAVTAAALMVLSLGCGRMNTAGGSPTASRSSDSLEREQVSGVAGVRLDSLLSSYAQQGFSGTVLAVRRGRIVLLKGYGFR